MLTSYDVCGEYQVDGAKTDQNTWSFRWLSRKLITKVQCWSAHRDRQEHVSVFVRRQDWLVNVTFATTSRLSSAAFADCLCKPQLYLSINYSCWLTNRLNVEVVLRRYIHHTLHGSKPPTRMHVIISKHYPISCEVLKSALTLYYATSCTALICLTSTILITIRKLLLTRAPTPRRQLFHMLVAADAAVASQAGRNTFSRCAISRYSGTRYG
jgi:hypothetical protein